jgi:hypothetical protein
MNGSASSRVLWSVARAGERRDRALRQGAIAGILGGGAIILLFLAYDALSFGPLATPDRLSGDLLGLESVVTDLGVRLGFLVRIGLFTLLHLGAFIAMGTLLVAFFRYSGVRSKVLFGGLYGVTVCTVAFLAALNASGAELMATPEWPALLFGNFVAGVVMGSYLEFSGSLEG